MASLQESGLSVHAIAPRLISDISQKIDSGKKSKRPTGVGSGPLQPTENMADLESAMGQRGAK
jgi:hypothetical protein